MADTSRVTFSRPKRGYRDLLRAYRLFIDGAPCGKIKRGGEISVDVAPGEHVVMARIDWAISNLLVFSVDAEEAVCIRVEPGGNAFQASKDWMDLGYIRFTLLPSTA